ncbi:hypothetical protein MRX96_001302 [Rhipicephalus microplus]
MVASSPDLQSMEQIRRIRRPTDVPETGLLCDLLWADPDKNIQGWDENICNVSFTFEAKVVYRFLTRHDLDLICRAHQLCDTETVRAERDQEDGLCTEQQVMPPRGPLKK